MNIVCIHRVSADIGPLARRIGLAKAMAARTGRGVGAGTTAGQVCGADVATFARLTISTPKSSMDDGPSVSEVLEPAL